MALFNNILYVSEATVDQEISLARAVALAENNQAKLTIIEIIPTITVGLGVLPSGYASGELQDAIARERLAALETLTAPYSKRLEITVDIRIGITFIEVIRLVLSKGYDLLIKAAENPNFIERLFGSDDMQLLRNCPCPVWLAPASKQSNYACVLAAIDFNNPYETEKVVDQLNQQILSLSSSIALGYFAALHFVHVWEAPAEMTVSLWSDNSTQASKAYVDGVRLRHEQALQRFSEQLKQHIGVDAYNHLAPQFHLRRGKAARAIPEMINELQADLVVMGTVARAGIAGLLIGNTAEAILEQVQCSVLAIKPAGFISPVKSTR